LSRQSLDSFIAPQFENICDATRRAEAFMAHHPVKSDAVGLNETNVSQDLDSMLTAMRLCKTVAVDATVST
jgi:hypothetical protein